MARKLGVLPTAFSEDPRSETALVFLTLADELDEATAKSWLTTLGNLITSLEAPIKKTWYASAVVALGTKFFTRFPEHGANNPAGLASPIALQGDPLSVDAVIHVNHTSEAVLATFLAGLWATRPTLESIEVEHGYSRNDGRETFGQLDGLRNLTRSQRTEHTRIDLDELPEEPSWLKGGCYGAWMKIEQNVDAWANLDPATKEQIIGRREADGSRTDLPAGTNPHTEGEFTDLGNPPVASHVRKAGPRGPAHDQTLILRRGAPYVEATGGALHRGLQFISYQVSLDDLDVILNQWMLNNDFPSPGAGQDALVVHGLLAFLRSCMFVVVPADDRHPAAGYFDPAPTPGKARKGRIHIRKKVTDAAGAPTRAELGGIEFTLIDPGSGGVIGSPVLTNSAGRAVLPATKSGKQVIVRETPNARFVAQADIPIDLTQRNQIVHVTNQLAPAQPPYGG